MIINHNLIKILKLLKKRELLCVSELATELKTCQPLISQRLASLKKLGLISAIYKDSNNRVFYRINDKYSSVVNHLILASQGLLS